MIFVLSRVRLLHSYRQGTGALFLIQEGTQKWYAYLMVCKEEDHRHCVLDEECDSRRVLDLVADKWAVVLVQTLARGTRRYTRLQREIGVISQKMRTQTLRGLECNGIVERRVYASVPPKVEYCLTPLGTSLFKVLKPLCEWSEEHFEEVEAARYGFRESRPAYPSSTS